MSVPSIDPSGLTNGLSLRVKFSLVLWFCPQNVKSQYLKFRHRLASNPPIAWGNLEKPQRQTKKTTKVTESKENGEEDQAANAMAYTTIYIKRVTEIHHSEKGHKLAELPGISRVNKTPTYRGEITPGKPIILCHLLGLHVTPFITIGLGLESCSFQKGFQVGLQMEYQTERERERTHGDKAGRKSSKDICLMMEIAANTMGPQSLHV